MGRVRWGAALGAAVVVLAGAGWQVPRAHRSASEDVCELRRADRARAATAACLACHDGTVGTGIAVPRASNRTGLDHPVDVSYAEAALRDGRLVPPALLSRDLVLVNGRVACTTCHDGASTLPFHVARPQRELCTGCHQL